MSTTRRFLLAPSLARVIERERGGHRVTEGYFPDQPDRSIHVRVEGHTGILVIVASGPGEPVEEAAELPSAHAETLLDFATGRIGYLRSRLSLCPCGGFIRRFTTPGPLDLIAVEFECNAQAQDFEPLPWFGPEVTARSGYHSHAIVLAGPPAVPAVEVTDTALNSLLATLEHGSAESTAPQLPNPSAPTEPAPAAEPEPDDKDLGIEDSGIPERARALRHQSHSHPAARTWENGNRSPIGSGHPGQHN